MATVTTIDFHITARCNQECPYCWGPKMDGPEVRTAVAVAIVRKIVQDGARRIVFTGGDPLMRADIGMLLRLSKELGLETAISTTGDSIPCGFLRAYHPWIDLISLPLDGANEDVSSRTKGPGHFHAIKDALERLTEFPGVDVKVATPVTRYNLDDVPNIVQLLDQKSKHMPNRLFYNVFQAFPRAQVETDWGDMLIPDPAFQTLRTVIERTPHRYRINWLDHSTLDRLYVMIFPDGTLTVPSGSHYRSVGPYLDIEDLEETLTQTDFDAPKHQRHSKGWGKTPESSPSRSPHPENPDTS